MKTLVWPNSQFDRPASAEISSFGNFPHSDTILSRSPQNLTEPSHSQTQADQLVSGFLSQATDWKSLAAMTAGGLAYRWGKISVMSSSLGTQLRHVAAMPLRGFAIAFGLSSEVTAFELTQRTLHTIEGEHISSPLQDLSPVTRHPSRLWSWSGPGGWKEGWLTSFVTFGTLKGFGKLAEGQNVILQHGFQDAGMVLGHRLIYQGGLGLKPEGTLSEQFLHAGVTNLQISAGMALGHSMTGGRIFALERGMDLHLASDIWPPVKESSKPETRNRNRRGTWAPNGLRTSLSRFLRSGHLAAAVPFSPEFLERIRQTDPELKALMDPIHLNNPHFPMVRLALAAGLVTIPLLLRPFNKKASEKARFFRDIAVPPLVGVSLLVGQGNSLDCYLPEIVAGAVTAVSWLRRGIAKGRGK
jgi:hypothetical protein